MKRLIFIISMILLASPVLKAQMNTGSKFIAGYNHFSFDAYGNKYVGTTSDPDKHFDVSLTAKGGYFLKNRLAIGGLADLGYIRIKNKSSDYKSISTDWLVGPLVRYYVEYGSLIPFGEASVGFGMSTYNSESGTYTNDTKHTNLTFRGGVGADYFLNESIAFEGMLDYYMTRLKPSGKNVTGEGELQSGLEFSIGIIFFFGTI